MDDTCSTLPNGQELLSDLRDLICETRSGMHRSINAGLTLLYWRIGRRIHVDQMAGQRARYGEVLFSRIAKALSAEFGTSFGEKSLRRMVQFSTAFADEQIVVSLIRQLSWTHFIALIPLADPLKRDFYAQMAATEAWSVRTLRQRIDSMLYERTALSSQPEQTIADELAALRGNQPVSPELVLRDPYVLDFLGLKDSWDEQDLESAILREMQGFLLELGELLELDRSGIHVAEYLTTLPPREVLKQRLQTAMERARQQLQTAPPSPR